MSQIGGTPVLILKEGTERRMGKSAKEENFAAAIAVAEMLKSSLGPKGMNKFWRLVAARHKKNKLKAPKSR